MVDSIGIVTVHDGPSLPPDEIIAPIVGSEAGGANFHNNFQDAEAFLRAGGRRGRQYQTLTDGTYFINRWFATLEMIPKTVVPIGYVGVVVSYVGRHGQDLSGKGFRHGEQVATRRARRVGKVRSAPASTRSTRTPARSSCVPTTNFVLHWITGKSEVAPLRRELAVDRPGDQGRLRAAVAAERGRAHRLRAGTERDPAVRRREEVDHADARPDAQRVLPRHRPHQDDARAAARARRDPAGSPRRAAAEVPQVRHRVRRRADRQADAASRATTRSKRCWSNCASGSCRPSSSKRSSAARRRPRSCRS